MTRLMISCNLWQNSSMHNALQVPRGHVRLLLDRGLMFQQPIHGLIQFVLIRLTRAQYL